MNFPYAAYEVEPTPSQPDVTIIYRPVIPFRVTGRLGAAVFYGLLDSGADETMLPREMAEAVGVAVDWTCTAIATSASGEMPVAYGEALLEVGRGKARHRWRAIVGVADQPWREAILGHAGFLHYFDAAFSWARRTVRLTRNSVPLPPSAPAT
jgi:hypothetical protein